MTAQTAAPPRPAATAPPAAHRSPDVRRWLAGYGVSLLGDQAFFLALAVGTTRVAGPGAVGLVLSLASIPRAALLLVGGALVDRWGERPVMLISDGLRCAVMLSAAGYVAAAGLGLPVLLCVALIFGAVDAVFLPAASALPQRLVEPAELGRINGLRTLAQRLSVAAGGPAAGWVIAGGGIGGAFLVDGLSFVASFAALATVRLRPIAARPARTPLRADITAGLRYVKRNPGLRLVLLLALLTDLGFAGPFNIGVPLAGWSAAAIGLITGGFGLGAIGFPLWMSVRGAVAHLHALRTLMFGISAASLASLGLATSLAAAVATAFTLGVGAGVLGTTTVVLIQEGLPDEFRGRVMALLTLATYGTVPVSFALTGFAVAAMGVRSTFLAASTLSLCAAALSLRHKHRP